MALLTREDLRRHAWFTWACLAMLAGVAAWLWLTGMQGAALGTMAALAGCLGLILPPRERMAVLPSRLRALPRRLDAAPVLATLLSTPGYGLGWFYGANSYDEIVHLVNGALAGAVVVALLQADGQWRPIRRLTLTAAAWGFGIGVVWEVFEWVTGLIGDWADTGTDVALTALGATITGALAGAWRGRAAAGPDATAPRRRMPHHAADLLRPELPAAPDPGQRVMPAPAGAKPTMLVATYNIHRGRGTAGWFRPGRIAGVIAEIRPDLIALQEAQHYFRRGTGMLDAEAIEHDLGLRLLRLAGRPGEQGWRSNLVLVRRDAEVLHGPVGLRLGGMEPRGAILVELDLGQGPFRLIATHLSLGAERRRLQAMALLAAMDTGAGRRLPTLLLGDLNEWRPRASALGVLAPVFGEPPPAPTFPAFHPIVSLDRIMAQPAGLVACLEVHDTALARRASDHLPLKARLDTAVLADGAGRPRQGEPMA